MFCRAVKASQAVLPFDDSSLRGCNSFNPVFNRTEVEEDNPTSQTILREIEKTCLLGHFDFILCPLAIGNQVDHLIVMNTMLRILETNPYLRKKVLFYEDLPYAGYYNSDSINKIVTTRICSKSAQYIDITGEMSVKLKLMDIYWSQGHKKTPILEHAKNLYGTQNNTNLNDYYERIWSFGCP